jgi:hypothetical protein
MTPRVTGHSMYTHIMTTHFNQHYIYIFFSVTDAVQYGLEIVTSSIDMLHNLHSIDIIICKYISSVQRSP